jgi:hypothetical protein
MNFTTTQEKEAVGKRLDVIGNILDSMLKSPKEPNQTQLAKLKKDLDELCAKFYLPTDTVFRDEKNEIEILAAERLGRALVAHNPKTKEGLDRRSTPEEDRQITKLVDRYFNTLNGDVSFALDKERKAVTRDPGDGETADPATPSWRIAEQLLLRARKLNDRFGELALREIALEKAGVELEKQVQHEKMKLESVQHEKEQPEEPKVLTKKELLSRYG